MPKKNESQNKRVAKVITIYMYFYQKYVFQAYWALNREW